MSTGTSSEEATAADTAAPTTAGSPDGDPTALGLPCFIAGSASFGLAQAGVVPGVTAGAALPVILGFAAIGIFITTIWAASLGRNAVASVFGIFAGFWPSYGMLLLGITHDWFGITPASARRPRSSTWRSG